MWSVWYSGTVYSGTRYTYSILYCTVLQSTVVHSTVYRCTDTQHCVLVLYANRKHIDEAKCVTPADLTKHLHVKLQYGSLFEAYNPNAYFFDLVDVEFGFSRVDFPP